MALGSLLVFLALLIVVALIVARPLGEIEDDDEFEAASPWIAERERVLEALAELDADWQLGKVPADIYKSQRAALLAKGATALKYLESSAKPARKTRAAKDPLEAEIAAHKRKRRK